MLNKRLAPWGPTLLALLVLASAAFGYDQWKQERDAKVKAACSHATVLAQIGLLEQAQRAVTRVVKEEHGSSCRGEAVKLASLRAERTRWFEEARTMRRAARFARRRVPDATVDQWREKAFEAYVRGLTVDPASPGARHGLRELLRSGRPRSAPEVGVHCARARRLLDIRLQREARAEYVRVRAAGRVCIDKIAADLRTQDGDAYSFLRTAEARERAGDRAGARQSYVEALAIDPGMDAAHAGLDRTRPEIPEPFSWANVAVKAPAMSSIGGFSAIVIAFLAIVLGATVVRVVRGIGRHRRFTAAFKRTWLRELIADAVEIRAPEPLSGRQWRALQAAAGSLERPPDLTGPADTAVPTEATVIDGAAPAVSSAVAAIPLLSRFDELLMVGRSIAGKRRASVTVEPVGELGFRVRPWIAWDKTPRGVRERLVVVPAEAVITPDELAWLLADAIREQRESDAPGNA